MIGTVRSSNFINNVNFKSFSVPAARFDCQVISERRTQEWTRDCDSVSDWQPCVPISQVKTRVLKGFKRLVHTNYKEKKKTFFIYCTSCGVKPYFGYFFFFFFFLSRFWYLALRFLPPPNPTEVIGISFVAPVALEKITFIKIQQFKIFIKIQTMSLLL